MVDLEATLSSALDGRYAIEGEVGRGGMSVVFRARDLKHNRTVAIKVLKPELSAAVSADRFHREVEIAAALSHPHILPLFDSGEADGHLYYVMPFVEGETLREMLERERQLSLDRALEIVTDIGRALASAHEHGVVHRDVKPANIFIGGDDAVLADFGVAHPMEPDGIRRLTTSGIALGTPSYMSPEQGTGDTHIDGRSDLYSLGCVLYELLAGEPPFSGATPRAVIARHVTDTPHEIRIVRPDLPPAIDRVIGKCLAKSPADRYCDVEQFLAELQRALAEPAESDLTGGTGKRTGGRVGRGSGRIAKRPRVLTWLLTAAVGLVLVAVGLALWDRVFPTPAAYGVSDPGGSFVILPADRDGQAPEEEELVVGLADWLAYRLAGLETVRVVQELDRRGAWADLGLEGRTIQDLETGLRVARSLRVGTLATVTLRVVGNTVYMEARQYDVREGHELGIVQSEAPLDDPALHETLVGPFLLAILDYREETIDPATLLQLSRNPQAHQEFRDGRTALYHWRLEEAEARFRAAIALDSTFALPHHYLALTLYWQTTRRAELTPEVGPEVARLTEGAARLAAESNLPSGYRAPIEAFRSFWIGDYDGARSRYDEILVHDSTSSEAWVLRGAVEYHDPWAIRTATGDLVPRSNLNVARRAFETSVRLARDHELSYGLLFEIDRLVLRAAYGWSCPAFLKPGAPPLPPWRVARAGDQSGFCPVKGDSIRWVSRDELDASLQPLAWEGAHELYQSTLSTIDMWIDYAPDQSRPREERSEWLLWRRAVLGCHADSAEVAEVTARALEDKRQELALKGDTTKDDRVRLASLLLAIGDPVEAERQLEPALRERANDAGTTGRSVPLEAANVFLATGRPSRALEILGPAWAATTFSYPDPIDGTLVPSGPIDPSFAVLRVLGASGVAGERAQAAFEDLDRKWSASEYTGRERALLRRGSLNWISPALLLAPEIQRAWFADMAEHSLEIPVLWRGLLASEEDLEEAARYLAEAGESLSNSLHPSPDRLYLAGVLAARLGDPAAVDHFARLESCPAAPGGGDLRWSLGRLATLQRARALEGLDRAREAAGAYNRFAAAWRLAEPPLQFMVTEARAAANRLADGDK